MSGPEPTPGLREALREAIDYARLSPTGERRKRWEAALAASPAPEPPGLDAARLCGTYDDHDWSHVGSPTYCRGCGVTWPAWDAGRKRLAARLREREA